MPCKPAVQAPVAHRRAVEGLAASVALVPQHATTARFALLDAVPVLVAFLIWQW